MSWQTTLTQIVRGLVFDLTIPYKYSSSRLEELILVASILVTQEVGFDVSYTINLDSSSITPDPVNNGDTAFQALVSLKTACMISQGEHRTAAAQAISFKDGPSTMDNRDTAKNLAAVSMTACEAYDKAKFNYMFGDGSLGLAIVGPYGIYQNNSNKR